MEPQQIRDVLEVSFAGGAFGLVVWVVQRTFKHTIPRLAEDFRAALTQQQAAYREDLKETREAFRDELRAERLTLQELLSAERGGRERMAARIEHLIVLIERLEERL